MKILSTVAIIALAGTSLALQAQAYQQKFASAKPELDRLMTSRQYKEVIEKIQATVPASIPQFAKDPADPNVAINSYIDLACIQDFHEYLYRAFLMSGDTESAISTIKRADGIASKNASDIEEALAPTIKTWSTAVAEAKENLEDAPSTKEDLEGEIAKLETKSKRSKPENKKLAEDKATLDTFLKDIAVWQGNVNNGTAVLAQLNGIIDGAKKDTTKFAQDIADMQKDLDTESEEIASSKFGGDKAKYVASAIGNKENLANLKTQTEKVKYLNRLLFLDPRNATVQKELAAVLGK
jgi:hypothetical protein